MQRVVGQLRVANCETHAPRWFHLGLTTFALVAIEYIFLSHMIHTVVTTSLNGKLIYMLLLFISSAVYVDPRDVTGVRFDSRLVTNRVHTAVNIYIFLFFFYI